MFLDLSRVAGDVLIGMQLEDELAAGRDLHTVADELRTVVALERLSRVGGADEHVVTMGKVVAAVACAIVEVGDSGDHNAVGGRAFLDEEVSVPLTGDAEAVVEAACPGPGGPGDPDRQQWRQLAETESEV